RFRSEFRPGGPGPRPDGPRLGGGDRPPRPAWQGEGANGQPGERRRRRRRRRRRGNGLPMQGGANATGASPPPGEAGEPVSFFQPQPGPMTRGAPAPPQPSGPDGQPIRKRRRRRRRGRGGRNREWRMHNGGGGNDGSGGGPPPSSGSGSISDGDAG